MSCFEVKLCADQIETSTSPPSPRAFDYLLCPGSEEFDLCPRGVGKIETEVSGFEKNTCLDEMEELKGRDIAFVSNCLTKKVFIKDDRSLQRLFFSRV